MRTYDTPGIYGERTDASSGGVAALRTDIAGFVGIAERGPIGIAVPVESARQFESWFGSPIDRGYLAYSARAFFENGGRRMWATRVASRAASTARLVLRDGVVDAWSLEASSPGSWGDGLAVRVTEVRRVQTRGTVDALDRALVHVAVTAGLERGVLVVGQMGAVRENAVVASVDPLDSTVRLERHLALLPPSAAIRLESVAYTIEVFGTRRLLAIYTDLSLVPTHPRYGPTVLKQPWQNVDPDHPDQADPRVPDADLAVEYFRHARNRSATAPPPIVIRELRSQAARAALNLLQGVGGAAPAVPAALMGGADGLADLRAADFIGGPVPPTVSAEAAALARRGLAALDAVDEVSLLAVPDIHIQPRIPHAIAEPPPCAPDSCLPGPLPSPALPPPAVAEMPPRFSSSEIYQVQAALVEQCERRRDRFALLDAPFDTCNRPTFTTAELRAWRMRFDSRFAALYAPWMLVVDPLRRGAFRSTTRTIPPSGHVAGQAAAIDLRLGVHVAPANVPLAWVQDGSLSFDDSQHGLLNSMGINLLRAQPGRGLRVLGARTVSSDTDWRFVNVRRLMSMIARSIDAAIQWAVFEPNDWRTRAKLTLAIDSFLRELWTRGAMVGASAEEAYFVRCDDTNNPPDVRALGHLHIDAGVAATVPFEFIVLRIGRDANGFTITADEPALDAP
jgi:phage tail sheath protein FI